MAQNKPRKPTRTRAARPPAGGQAKPAVRRARPRDAGAPRAGPSVAALCASAGGLEAFKAFLTAMPAESGIAFVLVPHLDPSHESLLVGLLARCTPMPVLEAVEGVRVAADHVYVLPPNKYMSIAGGALHLTGPVARTGVQTSIDLFLRALAEDREQEAIGIILSGTGSHGTLGARAIKAAGGMVMVQDPATAGHAGMPKNAVDGGVADYVLPVEKMPAALVDYVRHLGARTAVAADPEVEKDTFDAVLALVRDVTRVDFRGYRKKVLARRVQRRMGLGHFEALAEYLAFLRAHPDEVRHLHDDLLIRVTSFFRDAEAFDALVAQVLAPLVRSKEHDAPLRVWVPACATGEEAYSIAMLCLEQLALAKKHCPVQVFATDVDETPLQVARRGVYPESIAADVSAARLARFFTRTSDPGYMVRPELREAVVIAAQNLVADAPFSKLDLIACRNLLIYLEPELQQKVLSLFHFALNRGGCLLLGSSESIGRQTDLFESMSKRWRLYRRVGPSRPERLTFPIATAASARAQRSASEVEVRPLSLAGLVQRLLLEELAPAAVLVDHAFKILHYHGPARRYLDRAVAEPTQDLLALVADGLRTRLRTALQDAARNDEVAVVPDVQVKREDRHVVVRAKVMPVRAPRAAQGLLLVMFQDVPETATAPAGRRVRDEPLVPQLEYELKVVREDYQSNIEELERSNEDLKTAHEEVLSMNEELQSANEELETSKEELQSLNEEISTVNGQLQDKVDELERANSDVTNLMEATEIAVLFLDAELRIRRFTPAMTRLLPLRDADVGRPILTFASVFTRDDFLSDTRRVLDQHVTVETKVESDGGRHYLRRIVPYRTANDRTDGMVVTLVDISAHMSSLAEARRMAAVLRDSADAIMVWDLQGRVTSWNRGAERMYGYTELESRSLCLADLVPADARAAAEALFRSNVAGHILPSSPSARLTKDRRRLDVLITATPLVDERGRTVAIAETDRDVTELVGAQREIRSLNEQLEQRIVARTQALERSESRLHGMLDTAIDAIVTSDRNGTIVSVNPAAQRMFGCEERELLGQGIDVILPGRDGAPASDVVRDFQGMVSPQRRVGGTEGECRRKDGSLFPVDISVSTFLDADGPMFTAILRDISERKQMERHLAEVRLDEQLRLARDMHDGLGGLVTGIAMLAKTIHVSLERAGSPLAEQVAALAGYVRDVQTQLRQMAHGLMPVDVTPDGLSIALQRLAARHDAPEGPRCTFVGPRQLSLEQPRVVTHLYYIAQEALNNALRHGKPSRITVELDENDDRIALCVRDDGLGSSAPTGGDGMGLQTMRYRASLIGASLDIGSREGRGTEVLCTLRKKGREDTAGGDR
ncbi:MAG TPA: CheR family methyltransferase [Planctomycetota bacterium]|nr:CheR family methyltransferase [Planctomycetota bacterium]